MSPLTAPFRQHLRLTADFFPFRLHAPRVVVEFDVTNESDFVGSEVRSSLDTFLFSPTLTSATFRLPSQVPQVYLAFPKSAGEPPKVLRGFERVKLEGGETTHVKIELSMYDLSYWDVVTQASSLLFLSLLFLCSILTVLGLAFPLLSSPGRDPTESSPSTSESTRSTTNL